MEQINQLFSGWAHKMPWGAEWLEGNVQFGSIDVNRFFIILAAAALALVIILLAVIISACVKHKHNKAIKNDKPVVVNAAAPKAEEQNKSEDDLIVVEAKHEEIKVENKAAGDVSEKQPEPQPEEEATVDPHEEAVEAKQEEPKQEEVNVIEDDELDVDIPAQEEVKEEPAEVGSVEEVKEEPQPVEEVKPIEEAEAVEEVKEEPVAEEQPIEPAAEEIKEEPKQDEDLLDIDVVAPQEQVAADEVKEEPKQAKLAAVAVKNTKEKERNMEKKVIGSFEISLCIDGYRFRLYANNKQLLYESTGFTTVDGALKGIETFRKTVAESSCFVTNDKFGRFRYIFNKRYQGESYTTAKSAANAADSVKRFAPDAKLNVIDPTPEELAAYIDRKTNQRTKADVDWDKVAKDEAAAKPMGKLFVDEEKSDEEVIGYRYFLVANNGQILYTSAIYASAKSARDGIDAFKRAVYIGNFYIDEDKFGHFRYILRGEGNSTYVGESYTSKASAENAAKSVAKFVVCAPITNA